LPTSLRKAAALKFVMSFVTWSQGSHLLML
jgi:hypothetical protein